MKSRIKWVVFYLVLMLISVFVFYLLIGRLRTHSLPTGQIELSVPYSKYIMGETISFTVTNNFNSPVYSLNNCPEEPLGVYKLINGKWSRVHAKANKDCNAEKRNVGIPAHSSQTISLAPWQSLFDEVGKYRLVVFLDYYNALPYQDIEIINPPDRQTDSIPSTNTNPANTNTYNKDEGERETEQSIPNTSSSPSASTNQTNPVTYKVTVNSAGNYDLLNLNLKVGDSIQFIYSQPHDEVRTRFTALSVGSPAINPLTLDSQHTSRTLVFNYAGSWKFKADDHSGNTGTIVVN